MLKELLGDKTYTLEESKAFLETFENYQIDYKEIKNENIVVTPIEEVKYYCNEPEMRPFYKDIFTNKGKIYKYLFADAKCKLNDLTFCINIWKYRREYESEYFYTIDGFAEKGFKLTAYRFDSKKVDDKFIYTVKKRAGYYEKHYVSAIIDLKEYMEKKYCKKIHIDFDYNPDLINNIFYYNFETDDKKYHDREFDSILFDENYSYIGVLENNLTEEFFNEILINLYEHIYLQDENEKFYLITKFENSYQIIAYGEESNSEETVSYKEFINYIKNNIKLKRVFATR